MIYHSDIAGKAVSFPVKCHGANPEIPKKIIKSIMKRFQLPEKIFD